MGTPAMPRGSIPIEEAIISSSPAAWKVFVPALLWSEEGLVDPEAPSLPVGLSPEQKNTYNERQGLGLGNSS